MISYLLYIIYTHTYTCKYEAWGSKQPCISVFGQQWRYLNSCHQILGFRAQKYGKTKIIRGNSIIRCKTSRLDQTSEEGKGGKRMLKILIAAGALGASFGIGSKTPRTPIAGV